MTVHLLLYSLMKQPDGKKLYLLKIKKTEKTKNLKKEWGFQDEVHTCKTCTTATASKKTFIVLPIKQTFIFRYHGYRIYKK